MCPTVRPYTNLGNTNGFPGELDIVIRFTPSINTPVHLIMVGSPSASPGSPPSSCDLGTQASHGLVVNMPMCTWVYGPFWGRPARARMPSRGGCTNLPTARLVSEKLFLTFKRLF